MAGRFKAGGMPGYDPRSWGNLANLTHGVAVGCSISPRSELQANVCFKWGRLSSLPLRGIIPPRWGCVMLIMHPTGGSEASAPATARRPVRGYEPMQGATPRPRPSSA